MSDDEGTYFSEDDDDYDDFDELQSYSSLAQSFYEGFQAATNLLRNRFRPGASRSAWDRPHYNDDDALYGLQEGGFNGPVPKFRARPHVIEDGEDDEEDHLAVVETYSPYYMPRKLKIGLKHPDPVVEAASLASVDPTDTWYDLSLPSQIVNSGKLSALQLESITYACQQHDQMLKNGDRAGFLLGDGAGVGKGRTIAGLIFENYLKGRTRSIWISVSNDLKYDAERDLKDIGADEFIKVNILSKLSYNRIASGVNGFITSGVIFSTYSALIGHTTQTNAKFKTRLEQLLEWCGPDFEGVIVFDESHRAKNLCPENSRKPTKTGLTVQELQDRLPRARIVYASATGASEPRNMAYMTRLGIWGETSSFLDFKTFLSAVSKRGVSAMELVSMDLKLRGTYISRQLSFDGVTFKIEEVPLSPEFIAVYDESAKLWVKIKTVFEELAELLELDKDGLKKMWSQFWGAHQRFFKTLCISAKVSRAVAVARAAVSAGKCAVIGLQSTGEARMRGFLEKNNGELDEFVSSAKGVLENFVTKHFPSVDASQGKKRPATSQTRGNGVKRRGATRVNVPATCQPPAVSDATKIRKVETTKKEIMADIEALGARLPHNTLDQLIDELGGTGKVAEMTGRKGRVVRSCENGPISYELREAGDTPLDALNMTEKQYFMDGDKLIAIISEAASSGISLQSDRRVPNQRRRVHITLELPWSADRAVQQFGRTHRCNQVNAPEYVFLISALAGEKRFASIVAKRLETLGALTQGDRRATEKRDFTQFNFDNKYGRLALDSIMKSMFQTASPEAPTPAGFLDKASEALEGVGLIVVDKESKTKILHKDCNSVRRFLNRILGLPVELQNQMFDFFTDTLNVIINRAKKNGTFDLGIMDLGMGSEKVSRISVDRYVRKQATGVAVTELHALHGERGMSWTQAIDLYSDLIGKNEGFYLAREETFGKTTVLLAESYPDDKETLFTVHHPNTGAQPKKMTLTQLEKDYRAVTEADAESHWTKKYEASDTQCNHAYLRGRCRSVIAGFDCDIGLRKKKYFVLSGAVLCVWPRVEAILSEDRQTTKMRVIRLCTVDGARIIGAMIPKTCVDSLKEALSTDAEEVKREEFSSS